MNYTNTFRHFEYQGVSMSVTEAVMAMRLFIIQMAVPNRWNIKNFSSCYFHSFLI